MYSSAPWILVAEFERAGVPRSGGRRLVSLMVCVPARSPVINRHSSTDAFAVGFEIGRQLKTSVLPRVRFCNNFTLNQDPLAADFGQLRVRWLVILRKQAGVSLSDTSTLFSESWGKVVKSRYI